MPVKTRLVLVAAICALLGVRLLGVHLHVLTSDPAGGAALTHLAQYGEDGDAGHAAELDLVGKNLSMPLLPLPVGGGLLLLLMLPLPATVRLPRPPTRLGRRREPRYRLRPPSQAPPC